jgi:hypothetical protein
MSDGQKPIKGEMPVFMQALYGTVIGISFLKTFEGADTSVYWFSWKTISSFIFGREFYNFFLFAITLLIAAHDWYSYHNNKKIITDKFWHHVPQIFSLFFLAQMFLAATAGNSKYWYGHAFFYTMCNIINLYMPNDNRAKKNYKWIYPIHISLTLLGLCFFSNNFSYHWSHFAFIAVTFIMVSILWKFMDKQSSSQ